MRKIVLDASALMTFFEGRAGSEKVEELINLAMAGKRELLMSAVNWGEVYYSLWRASGESAAKRARAEIAQLPIEIVAADSELTQIAAEIHALYKLPYVDCFAASLARQRKAEVATADKDFERLEKEFRLLWTSGA